MRENDRKPAVYIYEANANPALLSEIRAGLEEEGIPCVVNKQNLNDAKVLAFNAANHSRLRVGIGITSKSAALQIRNCPMDKPVFLFELNPSSSKSKLRKLGTNAARAVKGGVFI